jgi:hypothetical protein
MTRSDLQQLAELRINEAKLLLDNGYYQGAYYICGYAIELALKACIVRGFQDQWLDKALVKELSKLHTHDLATLLNFNGLIRADLDRRTASNPAFGAAWRLALQWSADKRYEIKTGEKDAYDFYEAVTGTDGIVPWLRTKW